MELVLRNSLGEEKKQGRNSYVLSLNLLILFNMKKKKTKEEKLIEKIKSIYEKYPDKENEIRDWNKGGFYSNEKYKQPIKHRLYK